MKKAYLVLSDGTVFEGIRIGAEGETVGELVFTTSVVGYLEALTDPCYAGQILVQTFPLIGNYGVIPADLNGKAALRGYVVRELCDQPSNFRAEGTLDSFLKEQGIQGICGVDTRQITRHIRENGVMNAKICDTIPKDLSAVVSYQVHGETEHVSCNKITVHPAVGETKFRVTVVDFGVKKNLISMLTSRGCEVTLVPFRTTTEAILNEKPDGVLLSGGPGNPNAYKQAIGEIRDLIGKVPLLGLGLGHQLVALALGGKTVKMPYGHHGANQPVRENGTDRVYITGQNHGYAVLSESLAGVAEEIFVNANDNSCEGLIYKALKCFTLQFELDDIPGARNPAVLLDHFLSMVEV